MGYLKEAMGECCLTDFLYSPVYYWFKFVFSLVSAVFAGRLWNGYANACDDPSARLMIWCYLLVALWAIAGILHLGIIVGRFLKKSPPSEVLYDGPLVGMVYWPMTVCYGLVAVISLFGIVVFDSDSDDDASTTCADGLDAVVGHAYTYLFGSLALLKKVRRNSYQPIEQ